LRTFVVPAVLQQVLEASGAFSREELDAIRRLNGA
jgi:hypothetical protein